MSNINRTIPLLDLHRHLDGAVRLQTVLDLGIQHNLDLPSFELEGIRPHVQVSAPQPGLMAFLANFKWLSAILVDYDAVRRIAYESVEDAKDEGIDYIELRMSPWFMAESHGLDAAGVMEAVVDGVHSGSRDFGVAANLIGIISRHYGAETGMLELEALLSQRDNLVALDLAGNEGDFPGDLFVEHFKRGRDAGLRITVHAGEAAGAESVWQAVKGLGAERIGHGLNAIQDDGLIDYLAEKGISVEANLTSNYQTGGIPDYASHPLKRQMARGVLSNINTDDPSISGIDLAYEYDVAAPAAGLSLVEIEQLQRNALEMAFLGSAEKQALLDKYV